MVQQTGGEGGVGPIGGVEQYSVSATAVAIGAAGTIATNVDVSRVAPAGAVAGIILAPGTRDGQKVTVINESIAADTVTPAIAGTSHVADGVTGVLAGLTAQSYVWDAATALWYHSV